MQNLGSSISVKPSNRNAAEDTQWTSLKKQRQKNQSIIPFLLGGLKDGALKIATT